MVKKIALVGAIGVLIVAAVVGTVLAVVKNDDSGGHHHDSHLRTTTRIAGVGIDALCNSAANKYADACKRVFAAIPDGANVTEVIQAAGKATLVELRVAFGKSGEVAKSVSDEGTKEVLGACNEFLDEANDMMRAVIQEADNLESRALEMNIWISNVLALQNTCLDELQLPEVKEQMEKWLGNSTQLAGNALSIIYDLAKIAKAMPSDLINAVSGGGGDGRTLAEDGYPTWMSAGDRKLMASGNNGGAKPDAVVAQDGSGNYKTIGEAINAIPLKNTRRYVIYVKAGTYKEMVECKAQNVFMYGDGPRKSIITYDKHVVGSFSTSKTATFAATGKGFIAKGMGFMNTAGPQGHQAVALRVNSDESAFFNCRMNAYQDTLYTHGQRQFYSNCVISGTIDFIFGSGAAYFQNCLIILRRPMDNQFNTVTADGRTDPKSQTGIVIHNCRIVPESLLVPDRFKIKSYLGRPWKNAARTVVMETELSDAIRPEGWVIWDGQSYHQTCYYAEYNNRGPGAVPNSRPGWIKKQIDRKEAMQYTVGPFLGARTWLAATGAKFTDALRT